MINNISALILAAGKGTRMISQKTKVLHEVAGSAMIEHVICSCMAAGVNDIVIIAGANLKELKTALLPKYPRLKFVIQKKQLGTADAVKAGLKAKGLKKNILILSGDVPLVAAESLRGLINEFTAQKAGVIIGTAIVDNPKGYGRIIKNRDGRVTAIIEEKDADDSEKKVKEINGGVYVFDRRFLAGNINAIKKNPLKGEYYLTDIIGLLSRKSVKIKGKILDYAELCGINDRVQLAAAGKMKNKKTLEKLAKSGITIVDFDTVFIDPNVQIGVDTVINPFTVIKGKARIGKNCIIGPSAHIRPGTVIGDNCKIGNYVEIKNSKIGNNTNVAHLSYIGDAVLGNKVNIGAGTITANYDGKKKHKTVIRDGSHIGSNCVLVAPVTIGKNVTVGAGSVITENVPDNALAIARPRQTVKKNWASKRSGK